MSRFRNVPTRDLGAPRVHHKYHDFRFVFSSNIADWCPTSKPEIRKKYKEKGIRAVKGGEKFGGKQKQVAFRKANDAIKLSEPIIWIAANH